METKILGYRNQIFNENSYSQNFSSQPRPRSNSAPQERLLNSTSNSIINNREIQQLQQRRNVRSCFCGLEPVLREVKVNTINKGRYFWSCRKFGGPNHMRRCNFFRWENAPSMQNTDVIAVVAESSSTTQNTSETPHSFHTPHSLETPHNLETPNNFETPHSLETPNTNNTNINNYNDDDDDDDDDDNDNNNVDDGEVNLSPLPDQLTGNPRIIATPRRRNRVSLSQAPSSTTNRTIAAAGSNETFTTGDIYTRKPFVFGNWNNVPKYSTPELLDIFQNHVVQQDKNHQQWYNAAQLAKKDYEEAKKEVEKLMKELEIVNRENMLCKRENDVLKAEKRLLEMENNELKGENQELKRRH